MEAENQIKSLNLIVEDLRRVGKDKTSVEQRLEAKHNEIALLKEQLEEMREELLSKKFNLARKGDSALEQ